MIGKLFIVNLKALGAHYFTSGKKKAGVGKKILLAFLAVYIIAAFFGMFFALFLAMLEPFFSAGIGWMYFAFLALTTFGLCVISTLFTASAQLFGAKDNELLLSMPIKPPEILLSRLLVILAFEYVFTAIVASPAFILWVVGGYASPVGILFFVIGVLLLPLMAMALSLLLAWLLGVVTSRMRRKNILTLAISIGFLVAYFIMVANFQGYLNELVSRGEELARAFQQAMPPFYAFGKSIAEGSIGDGLLFMVWAIAPFTAAVILLSANYRKILTTNRGSAKTVYKEKAVKAGSVFSALVRKEMAHYWSKPFVILNTSLGSLFMLALSFMVIVKRADIFLYVDQVIPMFGNLPLAGAVILAFLNTVNNISASLISLEGKNLWIIKSIPAPPKVVIQSKICTHWMISGLPCLAASVCVAAVAAGSVVDWIILILIPQITGVLIAVCGVAVNLHFPKLDWTNETYVVKQGLSAMITMFGAIVLIIGLGVVYVFFINTAISPTAFLLLFTSLFAIIAILVYAWLLTSGVRKFDQL
jgi:ABC-2 type transport system permease protein